jgi:hypothetical protein
MTNTEEVLFRDPVQMKKNRTSNKSAGRQTADVQALVDEFLATQQLIAQQAEKVNRAEVEFRRKGVRSLPRAIIAYSALDAVRNAREWLSKLFFSAKLNGKKYAGLKSKKKAILLKGREAALPD